MAISNPTVLDVISSALRLIGVLGAEETPEASEAADALRVINDLWDSWNAERLMVFTIPRLVFNLTPLQQSYTVGPGGDFNIPRPASIDAIGIISLNNPAQPLELPMTMLNLQQWQDLPVKNIQGSLPLQVYDDGGYPLRTLSFWTVPTQTIQVALYPWAQLTQPATLTTVMAFPPGYARAFRYNLAVDLAAEFPVIPAEVLAPVQKIAIDSKAVVKSKNIPTLYLRCDDALLGSGGYYDYRSDTPVGGNN